MYKNNFDFLRHVFALCVVVAHCFPISGVGSCDWLCQLSNNQFDFSQLGVKGFFIISGYLIFQSLERSNSLFDYYWKRILRLFPGLLVVLVLTICLLPFVYNGSFLDYIANRSTLTYIPNNLVLYRTQYTIPGVFESNPYKSIINGSLWTIPYEFTLYILLSCLFYLKQSKKLTKIILLLTTIFLLVTNLFFADKLIGRNFILMSSHLVDLGFYFVAGSVLSVIKFNEFKYINVLLSIACVLIVGSLYVGFFEQIKYFILPIIVIGIGIKHTPLLSFLTEKTGDLSYGIYIYGFLIQQILMYYFHLNLWTLLICSLIIVPLFALFSWHIIEKKALSFKNYFKTRT